MVKYKLIQLYPGSKPLGYILNPVNNGLTKPDNYYQNGIWFNPSDYPTYWQEVKELTLLEEAKLRYPIGTKFKSVQYDSGVKISNNNIYEETYIHLPIIYCDGTTIYYNNKWAEIVDDFVLPEKWCVKVTPDNQKFINSVRDRGCSYTYITSDLILSDVKNSWWCNTEAKRKGFTEITFEQFKKYVLKEEITVKVKEKVVEKDYEILEIKGKYGAISSYNEKLDNDLKDKTIFKVKRISDGEIFTIGDKVFSEYVNYTINKIGIVNDKCMVSALYDTNNPNGSRLHYNLNNLKKAKQPLFTTEDGVDIFEGDIYYSINTSCWLEFETKGSFSNLLHPLFKHFSTKEKAEEYILMNKPCLSLSDVWDNLKVKDQKEVLKFVKSKLK